MNLAGKNAVITGATGAIGKAIAMALIGKEVNVCLLGRKDIDTSTYFESGCSSKVVVQAYKGDLENNAGLAAFCEYVSEQVPAVDILVHCAGAYYAGTVEDTPVEELDRLYRINVRAPYVLTQLLLPKLRQSKGQVVFMNSSAGVKAGARLSQYASSKFALHALSDCLRQEVNNDEIRVLSVFPGRTASKMQEAVHRFEQREFDPENLIQPQDIAQVIIKSLELPVTAEVTDIHIRPFRKPASESTKN